MMTCEKCGGMMKFLTGSATVGGDCITYSSYSEDSTYQCVDCGQCERRQVSYRHKLKWRATKFGGLVLERVDIPDA